MCNQLKIWKRLITNQIPSSCHRHSIAISFLPSLPLYGKPHFKFANFCNQIANTSMTPPHRGVVTDFLITKCGLTDEDIIKAFRYGPGLLRRKSTQNMEEVLELLKGCGLTTPAQVRQVILCNKKFLFLRSERNIKSKLSFFRTFIKEEDISRIVIRGATISDLRKDTLKSRASHLLSSGFEGKALSHLVVKQPLLLRVSEEKVTELFQQIENLGFKKGSKSFAAAVFVFLTHGKETIERKFQCLRSLGFSEKQISELSRRQPQIMACSVEKLKRNVDFVVNSMGLLLADLVKYPQLFSYSLEKRIIPRYRVMEALKSMRVQELKRETSLPRIIKLTEKRFLEKYVNENPESSILLDIYRSEKTGEKEIQGSYESSSGRCT